MDRHQLDEYFAAIRTAESDLSDLTGRTRILLNLILLMMPTDSSRIITIVIQNRGVVPTIVQRPAVSQTHS